jgi:hypothetical protein
MQIIIKRGGSPDVTEVLNALTNTVFDGDGSAWSPTPRQVRELTRLFGIKSHTDTDPGLLDAWLTGAEDRLEDETIESGDLAVGEVVMDYIQLPEPLADSESVSRLQQAGLLVIEDGGSVALGFRPDLFNAWRGETDAFAPVVPIR